MTICVRAAAIQPDLRFFLAWTLPGPASPDTLDAVRLSVQGCLPPTAPAYLRLADRDALVVAEGVDHPAELSAWLAEQIEHLPVSDARSSAVITLDALDRCFRDSGLWPGNVYLAGTPALPAAQHLADAGGAAHDAETVLRELAALELVYLFPIAGKFRSGGYDGQVQYRLNGWGRTLARRLTTAPAGGLRSVTSSARISQHLTAERRRYADFLNGLDVARQHYIGDQLTRALALPIPVLV